MCLHVAGDGEVCTCVARDGEVCTHVARDCEVCTHVARDCEVCTHVARDCEVCMHVARDYEVYYMHVCRDREVCMPVGRGGMALKRAAYGQGTGPVLMDDVFCAGNENELGECNFVTGQSINCGHSEDASVVCQAAGAQPTLTPRTTTARPGVTLSNNCNSGKEQATTC